uniref:E3 ubiquitin-protein ligase n=1 Tax=Odontella aurita TaxID=265563 RepID=A0A7S4J7V0_9STRA
MGVSVGDADGGAASWTIDPELRSLVSGMLSNLPNLWPEESKPSTGDKDASSGGGGLSAKSREARKAAQMRALERIRKQQASFAASLGGADSSQTDNGDGEDDEEADLCIICRCDDADGNSHSGPLGFLGHVQRSRVLQLRSSSEIGRLTWASREGGEEKETAETADEGMGGPHELHRAYRVVGNKGCQLRATEAMNSAPVACLPPGSVVTVLESRASPRYDLLSRRVLVRHRSIDVPAEPAAGDNKRPSPANLPEAVEGWASVTSSQGYVILAPLSDLCCLSTRWGPTRPIVRLCGHAAHVRCVEAHTLSLHQRAAGDQPYDGRFAANIDDGEFLCPLCKQLSNVLVPRDRKSSSSSGRGSDGKQGAEAESSGASAPDLDTLPPLEQLSALRSVLSSAAAASTPNCPPSENDGIDDDDSPENKDERLAARRFGDQLLQAVAPTDRSTSAARRRREKEWHPALRRWDFDEEREDDLWPCPSGLESGRSEEPVVGDLLHLLRQVHVAWAALGHSAASAEAAARGVLEPNGMAGLPTDEPWAEFGKASKDNHPMLLELRRMAAATSGLTEVAGTEIDRQLGGSAKPAASSNAKSFSLIGSLLSDIFSGTFWTQSDADALPSTKQWQVLTALLAAMPCHVARDGTISRRHEARAAAAAMWATRGFGVPRPFASAPVSPRDAPSTSVRAVSAVSAVALPAVEGGEVGAVMQPQPQVEVMRREDGGGSGGGEDFSQRLRRLEEDMSFVPAPLSVAQICGGGSSSGAEDGAGSAAGAVDRSENPGLEALWGTMDPSSPSTPGALPFRPAVASAFLYVPLLAWDLQTLAGAIFSAILASDRASRGCITLDASARMLLLARLVQALISPDGFDVDVGTVEDDFDLGEMEEFWTEEELLTEGAALVCLLRRCRTASGSRAPADHIPKGWVETKGFDSSKNAARFVKRVGYAVLPFARTLVLLLRACYSAVRQRSRQSRAGGNGEGKLERLLVDPELMTYEDGLLMVKLMGGPLPSAAMKSWMEVVDRWLASVRALESYHGSRGRTLTFDAGAKEWKAAAEGDTAATNGTADATSKVVVKDAAGVKDDLAMGVEVEVVQAEGQAEAASLDLANIGTENSVDMEDVGSAHGQHGIDGDEHMSDNESDTHSSDGGDHPFPNVRIQGSMAGDSDSSNDEELLEDMEMVADEVDVEEEEIDEEDLVAFGDAMGERAAALEAGFGPGAVGPDGLPPFGEDTFDDSSLDEDEDDSSVANSDDRDYTSRIAIRKRRAQDKLLAYTSSAPILPYQPSLLGSAEVGAGPRGGKLALGPASRVSSDLSHLGMVHRPGPVSSSLIRLPRSFVELYGLVNKVKGRGAGGGGDGVPNAGADGDDDAGSSETAICLLTGTIMSSGSSRRHYSRANRPPGACTLHAQRVGSGIGVFFLVQKCTVLLVHNNKSAYSASLYVDENGEEDPGLRRGRPLFLKGERYEALEGLWRKHGVPREVAQIRSTSDRVIRDNWY